MVRSNSIRIWFVLLAAITWQQGQLAASSGIPANVKALPILTKACCHEDKNHRATFQKESAHLHLHVVI